MRAAAPAPVAITSGNVPKINASEVIRIGRKRVRPPSSAARSILSPAAWKSLAKATINMAFFAVSAIRRIIPIWVYRLIGSLIILHPITTPNMEIGNPSKTAMGLVQLSYCAGFACCQIL